MLPITVPGVIEGWYERIFFCEIIYIKIYIRQKGFLLKKKWFLLAIRIENTKQCMHVTNRLILGRMPCGVVCSSHSSKYDWRVRFDHVAVPYVITTIPLSVWCRRTIYVSMSITKTITEQCFLFSTPSHLRKAAFTVFFPFASPIQLIEKESAT